METLPATLLFFAAVLGLWQTVLFIGWVAILSSGRNATMGILPGFLAILIGGAGFLIHTGHLQL